MARVSRRILHDPSLADDAIQEAFVNFWMQGDPPENPQAWLRQAVTLRSLHLARTNRRRRKHEQLACLGRSERSSIDDPARSLDNGDFLRMLDAALGRIAEEYRVVFVLWAIEEMDYTGIAETLRIPIGTVRSRVSRSRRAVREALSTMLAEQEFREPHTLSPVIHPPG